MEAPRMVPGPRSSSAALLLAPVFALALLAACGQAPRPGVVLTSPAADETLLPFGSGRIEGRLDGAIVLRVRVRTGAKVFTFDATPGWHLGFEHPVAAALEGHGTLRSYLLGTKLATGIEAGLQPSVFVAEVASGEKARRAAEASTQGWLGTRLVALVHLGADGAFDLVVPFPKGEDRVAVSLQAVGRRGPLAGTVSRTFTLRPGVVVEVPVAVAALRAALEVHALDAPAVATLLGPYGEAGAESFAAVRGAPGLPARADVVEVLGRLGRTSALIRALEDPTTDVRKAAMRWLEPKASTSAEVLDAFRALLREAALDAEVYELAKRAILRADVDAIRASLGDLLRAAVLRPRIDANLTVWLAHEPGLRSALEAHTQVDEPALRMLALVSLVEGTEPTDGEEERKNPWVARLREEVRLREAAGGGDEDVLDLGRSTLRSLRRRAGR